MKYSLCYELIVTLKNGRTKSYGLYRSRIEAKEKAKELGYDNFIIDPVIR